MLGRVMPRVAALSLALLLAGCLAPAAPAPAAAPAPLVEERNARDDDEPVEGPVGGPDTETTRTYSGLIVLRPGCGSCALYRESGNAASFCFHLPTNVALLRGVFGFSPAQQAGLEFHGHDPYVYYNTWDDDPKEIVAPAQSPLVLEVEDPGSGEWFVYGGPGAVGGMMEWSLDLTMVTRGEPSEEAVDYFETIDPAC